MTTKIDLIKNIIKVVEKEKVITVSDLAKEVGSNWATIQYNVELLVVCEKVYFKKIKSMNLVIYR